MNATLAWTNVLTLHVLAPVLLVTIALVCIIGFIWFHAFAFPSFWSCTRLPPPPARHPRLVVVSGCDTGFGHDVALALARMDGEYRVLAGCLTAQGEQALRSRNYHPANLVTFHLDVTNAKDIDAMADLVQREYDAIHANDSPSSSSSSSSQPAVLHALINNAGIADTGYIDWTSNDTYQRVLDVNFMGHVRMTRALLPLLVRQRGSRVINVTSSAGLLAAQTMSAYSASKFALESFSDALRREMGPYTVFGLHVSIIEPGFMNTPMVRHTECDADRVWSRLSPGAQERWGRAFVEAQTKRTSGVFHVMEDPHLVVCDIVHAVISVTPYLRYHSGCLAKLLMIVALLPACVVDWCLAAANPLGIVGPSAWWRQLRGTRARADPDQVLPACCAGGASASAAS